MGRSESGSPSASIVLPAGRDWDPYLAGSARRRLMPDRTAAVALARGERPEDRLDLGVAWTVEGAAIGPAPVERGQALLVAEVRVCSALEQAAHAGRPAVLSGDTQRLPPPDLVERVNQCARI